MNAGNLEIEVEDVRTHSGRTALRHMKTQFPRRMPIYTIPSPNFDNPTWATMRAFHSLLLALTSLVTLTQALQYRGADFSSLINVENQGVRYKHNGQTQPFETILKNQGCNLARIRIWTSNNYNEYNLAYGLALAKRAAAAGMDIYVDLHYSDTCECL